MFPTTGRKAEHGLSCSVTSALSSKCAASKQSPSVLIRALYCCPGTQGYGDARKFVISPQSETSVAINKKQGQLLLVDCPMACMSDLVPIGVVFLCCCGMYKE